MNMYLKLGVETKLFYKLFSMVIPELGVLTSPGLINDIEPNF